METMTVLDKVTEAIERVLKSASPTLKTKELTREGLLTYAVEQIEKASKESPTQATQRLSALGRMVETAKQAFLDSDSESIQVQVFEEETTAAADQTETETALTAAGAGLGNSAFAQNAEDLNKVLARTVVELKALRGERGGKKSTPPADDKVEKAQDVAWPFDMNTAEFREGVKKTEDAPAWGDDPKELRARGA